MLGKVGSAVDEIVQAVRAVRSRKRTDEHPYRCALEEHAGLQCLVLTPQELDWSELWVLVFLHGGGHKLGPLRPPLPYALVGCALPRLAYTGEMPRHEDGRALPFAVVCPQSRCKFWTPQFKEIGELAQDVICVHKARKQAWFVTGISMGANASWRLTTRVQPKPAAVVPVSPAAGVVNEADTTTPAWVFAGKRDNAGKRGKKDYGADKVENELMAKRQVDNVNTKFTPDPRGGHNCRMWNQVYGRRDVYEWLLEHAP